MKRSFVVPLLVAVPLAIAGCGGSGATPRTAAGVRSDYVQFAKLAAAGNGAAACSRFISPIVVAELDGLGGCAKLLDYAVAQKSFSASTVTNGWTASVNGSKATYRTTSATGTAVYADGHWMFSENSSTSTSTQSDDAAAKELAHTAQVAIETMATDNNGSYAGATPKLLNQYESTIQLGPGSGNAYIAANGVTVLGGGTGYNVTATSTTGDSFGITRSASGALSRSCRPSGQGGCSSGGSW